MSNKSPWITVGELADAFGPDSNTPAATDELSGKTLTLAFENGQVIVHQFTAPDRLKWEITEGTDAGAKAEETYLAFKIREGIYFVDFVKHQEQAMTATLVLDLNQGIVTALIVQLPEEEETKLTLLDRIAAGKELTAVKAHFQSGVIDRPFTNDAPRHTPTDELVNRRVEYTYSPTECYEHIYLNEQFYTWHCLQGAEKGLCDTDRCHYHKVADDLYLFTWQEKIVPALGAIMLDLAQMQTAGKIVGYEDMSFKKVANFPAGARARLVNITERSS